MMRTLAILFLLVAIGRCATTTNTYTVKASGGDYTTLAAWEDARDGDLTAGDVCEKASIEGAWASADSTAVTVTGWTTDATRNIQIIATGDARHSGVYSESKYRLELVNATCLYVQEECVTVSGLQIKVTANDDYYALREAATGEKHQVYENNIILGILSGASDSVGIRSVNGSGGALDIRNNIIYGFTNSTYSPKGMELNDAEVTFNVYNNTVVYSRIGWNIGSGTVVMKNNIANKCADGFAGTAPGTANNNCSDIASDAPGTAAQTGTVSFVSLSAGSEDFHLASGDTVAKNNGADLSGAFTIDIDGQTRSGSWDIGADEYVVTGGATPYSFRFLRGLRR